MQLDGNKGLICLHVNDAFQEDLRKKVSARSSLSVRLANQPAFLRRELCVYEPRTQVETTLNVYLP